MLSVIGAPKFAKGYAVHIVFMSFALLASPVIAIWTIIVGQQLRGRLRHDFYCLRSDSPGNGLGAAQVIF